jgi:tellurite resistance protein
VVEVDAHSARETETSPNALGTEETMNQATTTATTAVVLEASPPQRPANDVLAASGSALLSLFAAPLGIAGLGGVWQALRGTVGAPAWPAEVLLALCGALWLALTGRYVLSVIHRSKGYTADLTHVIYGPFVAYVPVIGILLSAHYVQYLHGIAKALVAIFVTALAVLAAQLLAHWLRGNLPVATFHPGYFLPTVAGAFIASIGLSSSGWREAAQAAFGVGIFFWLVIGTLIFGRLFTGAPLPDEIKPALSVLVSPPAVAGIAWVVQAGGRMDAVAYVLLGILAMMLLVQVLFLAEYRRLPFTVNFWAFTFPVAASTNFAVRWLAEAHSPLWRVWTWTAATLATAFVLGVALATVLTIARHVRRAHPSRG